MCKKTFLLFALGFILLGPFIPCVLAQVNPIRTQDVIIVIDNSGSMDNKEWARRVGKTLSDPEGRRFDAAKLVISYLAVYTVEGQRHYRVSIVSFGKNAILLAPLERVLPGYIAEHLRQSVEEERDLEKRRIDYSYTNPHVALEMALQEMEDKASFEQTEPPVVILITDGRFTENSLRKSREEYIKEVEAVVRELAQKKGKLYAVLIGEAREDEAEWQGLADLTGGAVFSLSDPNTLIEVYHNLIRNLVGAEAFGVATSGPIPIRAEDKRSRSLEIREEDYPYLDALIFTVFQTQPDINVTFIQPDGQKLVPIPEKVEREGEQYVIVWRILRPQYGEWQVELRGGSKDGQVQYWVDVRHITLQVQSPDPQQPLPPGQPVKILVKLVDEKGIVKERPKFPIIIDVAVTRPDGHQTTDRMNKQDDAYVFTLKDTEQRGEYKLEFKVKWTTPEGVETLVHRRESSFRIAAVPSIKAIRTEPRADQPIQAKEPFRVEASITNVAEQERLQVFAQVVDQQGARIGKAVELFPSEAFPNLYSGELLFDKIGQYTITVYLTGLSKDGIAYGPSEDLSIERSFPVQVVAKIPSIKNIRTEPRVNQSIQVKEPLHLEISVENVVEQERLQAFAQVIDRQGEQIGKPLELIPSKTLPNIYSGELLFNKTGQYTVTVYLLGLSKGGVAYGPGQALQIEKSFSVRVVTELPHLEEVNFQPSRSAIPTRQDVFIYARVSKFDKAQNLKVFAQAQGIKGEWLLRDDGVKPDETSGDGIFTGRLPGFGRNRLPGLGGEGTYVITLTLQGEDLTGESFSISQEYLVQVVASPLDWAVRGCSAFLLLVLISFSAFQWRKRRREHYPLGTLRILRPTKMKGRQWFLDEFVSKEVLLGLDVGHISLPAIEGWPEGLYARFYGRKEGREVVTYIEGLSQERPILLSGTPLAKGEKARLFEGSTVEIGGYILEYLAPQLVTY